MGDWVSRMIEAARADDTRISQEEKLCAEKLAIRVSRLIGEVVEPSYYTRGYILVEGVFNGFPSKVRFVVDENDELALERGCAACSKDYRIPVPNRQTLGRALRGSIGEHIGCEKAPNR